METKTWEVTCERGNTTEVTGTQSALVEVVSGMERGGVRVVSIQPQKRQDNPLRKVEKLEILDI